MFNRPRVEPSQQGGGDALQTDIDGASDGDTIVVTDSATYDPVVVDAGVTVGATADTVVAHSHVSDVTSAETILPEAGKIDGDGGGVTFRGNEFPVAVGLNNRNGSDGGSRDPSEDPTVDARTNYWGSPDGPEEATFNQAADDDDRSDVVGDVRYEPFLRRSPDGQGRGRGR